MSRKAAEAAAKEKNEYIPSFITKKPFWVPDDESGASNDYLDHQRLQKDTTDQSKWYDRGKRLGPAATKFRKGACENCGAMTHKTKECLSRPRAKGARWTGQDIQADEMVQDMELGWDAKRDRWNGYDAAEYRNVVEEYETLEELKKRAQREKADPERDADGALVADDLTLAMEEARYAEESDMGRQQSTATRNLRLREDTAKYLLNLDLDSAKYDPKSRSMVDMGAQADAAAALVADDNFMRAAGDAAEFEKAQKYAWESQERGGKDMVHIQANPTSGEYFRRKEMEAAEVKREARRKMLADKYGGGGGDEVLSKSSATSAALLRDTVVESESYVEYDESGAVKGAPKLPSKSKYAEDVLANNHAAVWGSWWCDFRWGYACCHSTIKNSYCTGEEGRRAFEEAAGMRTGVALLSTSTADAERADADADADTGAKGLIEWSSNGAGRAKERSKGRTTERARRERDGDDDGDGDGDRDGDGDGDGDAKRKRTAEQMKGGVTEEEVEAYKRSRMQADDPMAKLLGTDELVH